MTPQQIELALETIALVLEDLKKTQEKQQATITAIKEALAEHAMKETQRLGQEIEQKIGCVNHDCDQCKAQPEQEPVAWMFQHDETGRMTYVSNDGIHNPTMFLEMNPRYALVCLLYTTPPQRTEQNFCHRCGKRTKDIHTCTPPKETT